MFEAKSKEQIFGIFTKIENPIKNTQKIPIQDSDYQLYILNYKDFEVTPDVQLFGYEKSILENRYIQKEYPNLAKQVWMFARSGQGDEWFFTQDTETILYYDHNKGEYQTIKDFLNLNVSFWQFLQIAFLYHDLETRLDETNDNLNANEKDDFILKVSEIDTNFYSNYPYVYF